ncbi:MAG: MauE/DoxX family redox-associated membrane protein [Crinalium sp.]
MFNDIVNLSSVLVGIVFVLTGVAKVIEPWKFFEHIATLRLLHEFQSIRLTTLTFTGIECALGVALILGVFPSQLIPVSILLLIGLTVLTYWSTFTGRTEDCGCYNGWLKVTPIQSIILNLVYITLLVFAAFFGNYQSTVLWQWIVVLVTLITSGALASGSLEYYGKNGRPYIDLTPIKANRTWKPEWFGEDSDATLFMSGSKLVVFLGIQCPACKNWLNILNLVHYRDDLPFVIGMIALNTIEEGQDFVDSYGLNYPIVPTEQKQQQKLGINAVPTAVLLENGVIKEKWTGTMPEYFIEQIHQGDLSYPA